MQLGKTFYRCAIGPVNYAGTCIMGKRVPEGLQNLAPDALQGAVERGIADVATRVGVSRIAVEDTLPMDRMRPVMTRIKEDQRAAAEAWKLHAGGFGGLLDGVADLTVDGRAPDVPLCLERLANKVKADDVLAAPVLRLAKDIAEWQELLLDGRARLDDGEALKRAFQARRRRKIALWSSVGSVVSVSAVVGFGLWEARSTIDEGLARIAAEPCTAETLTEDDLRWASDEQSARHTAALAECAENRRQEAERIRAEEERIAAEKAAEEALRIRREACAGLSAYARGDGELTPEMKDAVGDEGGLLERVRKGAIAADDLASSPTFPCADHPVEAELEEAMASALAGDPDIWRRADHIHPDVAALIAGKSEALPLLVKTTFAEHAERSANGALQSGSDERISMAQSLCRLADQMKVPGRGGCQAVLRLGEG